MVQVTKEELEQMVTDRLDNKEIAAVLQCNVKQVNYLLKLHGIRRSEMFHNVEKYGQRALVDIDPVPRDYDKYFDGTIDEILDKAWDYGL